MAFVSYMKRVLHQMHRFWIRDNANTLKDDPVRPLDNLLMFYWREDLLSEMPQVIEMALELVDQDRRGLPVDYSLIRGVVDTLVEIGAADVVTPPEESSPDQTFSTLPTLHLYIRVFEDEFLTRTKLFYKAEGEKMVNVGDATQFTRNVLARLEEEAERGHRLLHADSVPRLSQATEHQLIGNHLEYLQNEAIAMVRAGREDDLKLIFTLLKRIDDGLHPLRTFFVGFIRTEGSAVVNQHIGKLSGKEDMHSNLELVRLLIRLHRKHATLIHRCFDGAHTIMTAIDDAFRGFMNRALGNISLPNLIAHYVDQVLRQGEKFDREMWDIPSGEDTPNAKRRKLSHNSQPPDNSNTSNTAASSAAASQTLAVTSSQHETEVRSSPKERSLESRLSHYLAELVRLFMYLDEKDLFFETHRRLFAKRLMSHHDEDLETDFISMIKVQMGPTYTQRLSGMLQDKLASNTMQKEFSKYLTERREECARRKDDILVPFRIGVLDEDVITPVENCVERRGLEKMADRLLGTKVSHVPMSAHGIAETGPAVSTDANLGTGWSMLLNVTNAHREKDIVEQRERNVKSTKIDENILKFEEALEINFNAHVLNALHWPSVEVANLRLPSVLMACQELFSDFYMRDKETRKLSWIHALSVVHLLGTFSGLGYTFVVSTFQACILMLFNECDRIRVKDARDMLNLSLEQLCHHIKPLIVSRKCRVLRLERRPAIEKVAGNGTPTAPATNGESNGPRSTSMNPMHSTPNDSQSGTPHSAGAQMPSSEATRLSGDTTAANTLNSTVVPVHDSSISADGERSQPPVLDSITVSGAAATSNGDEYVRNGAPTSIETTDTTSAARSQGPGEGDENDVQRNPDSTKRSGLREEGDSGSQKNASSESGPSDAKLMQDADILHINFGFKSRLHRVVVPASIPKVANSDTAMSKKQVVVDRSTRVDAALVRIMKTKKELTHTVLNALVVGELAPAFLPDPRLIKKRLERLIEQEYVERDKDDPRLYRYAS